MANPYTCIAVDLGAESGRVMLARLTDEAVTIEEVHRFPNGPIEQEGSLRWDFERLFTEIKQGIKMAAQKERRIDSIGRIPRQPRAGLFSSVQPWPEWTLS